MPVTRLYHPTDIELNQVIKLGNDASHHLIRVMRTRKGSDVILFNGDGFEYQATILDENQKCCSLSINSKINTRRESHLNITLLQGISRSHRMDTCLQKSTELGINAIIPVVCDKTTTKLKQGRAEKKLKHWEQVIVSACEQSGRCTMPEIHDISTYDEALKFINDGLKLILDPDTKTGLKSLSNTHSNITILVGPESGLTKDEIKLASNAGFTAINLGPRILRTETAGPACIAAIQTLWGDMGGD